MAVVTMKQLLEAGSHFGHQTKRWNPKMKKYIFGSRNGIYIIDLQKTLKRLTEAYEYVRDLVAAGGFVLFIGTKKQAVESIAEEAKRCGMFFINQRWLGGILTNFATIKKRALRLKELEAMKEGGAFKNLPKKEVSKLEKELSKLQKYLEGIKDMDKLPGAVFIVDPRKERIPLSEAMKLGITSIAIVDTNCDPDGIDFVIPSNDDAIRSIRLITSKIADACLEGRSLAESAKADAAAMEEKEAEKIGEPEAFQAKA